MQSKNKSYTKFPSKNVSTLKIYANTNNTSLKTCARDITLNCLPFSNHKTRLDMIISVEDGNIHSNHALNRSFS